jgi:hypothetical protein
MELINNETVTLCHGLKMPAADVNIRPAAMGAFGKAAFEAEQFMDI